jgi:hypothetical protein
VLVAALAGRLGASQARAVAALGLCPLLLIAEVGGFHQDVPAGAVPGRRRLVPRPRARAGGVALGGPGGGRAGRAGRGHQAVVRHRRRDRRARGDPAPDRRWPGRPSSPRRPCSSWPPVYGGALPNLRTQGSLVTPLSLPNLLGLGAGHGGADPAVRDWARWLLVAVAAVATGLVAVRRERALAALGAGAVLRRCSRCPG